MQLPLYQTEGIADAMAGEDGPVGTDGTGAGDGQSRRPWSRPTAQSCLHCLGLGRRQWVCMVRETRPHQPCHGRNGTVLRAGPVGSGILVIAMGQGQ